ncbi:hypothetical protein PGTUg99_000074 [Puccinia graminis f. sp. tritici]|uniref:BCD1 alpha/beta domain-containing protein n=2 Tax=Puccinia graminis f. sp. tritici TaxID=56615 RepID=A0A5B0R115_PUCGR|nr:hypothetical protein PGTUg99_000074 [Puccinia graminis f. sp. tritici]
MAALEAVRLLLMPDGMSRRTMNMTNYNHKKKCMQWSVELVFPSDEQAQEAVPQPTSQDRSSSSSTLTPPPPPTTPTVTRHQHTSHLIHQISSDTTIIELVRRTLNLKKLQMSPARKRRLLELVGREEQREKAKQDTRDSDEKAETGEGGGSSKEDEGGSKPNAEEAEEAEDLIFMLRLERAEPSSGETEEEGGAEESERAGAGAVRKLGPMERLRTALEGLEVVEWPRLEVIEASEWTRGLEAGRLRECVRIIPPRPTRPSSTTPGLKRPVDSGWPAHKRTRTTPPDIPPAISAPPLPTPLTSSPLPSLILHPPPSIPSLSSLLHHYSSSEDDQSP